MSASRHPDRSRAIRFSLLVAFLAAGAAYRADAQTCVANVPHVDGQWVTLPYLMPVNPISATLLHDGRVLLVSGSEYDGANNSAGSESYRNALWDPTGTTQSSIAVQHIEYDVFCAGTAVLPDGRPLVVGGTSDYTVHADNRASIFDPATAGFLQAQSMADGRWYGTATALGDGRIMAFSGVSLSGGTNRTVEIYDLRNAGAGWTSPVAAPFTPPLFPRMTLLPNGRVFFTGQAGGYGGTTLNSWIFDPTASTWTMSAPTTIDRHYGSAVLLPLLPPSYTPRVMNFGGGTPVLSTTELIDLSAASPSWTPGPRMSTGRIQMNAIILPNGKVLAEVRGRRRGGGGCSAPRRASSSSMRSGISPTNSRNADLLFQVVSRRHEKKSLVLTTNLAFSDWPTIFPNAGSAIALIDRIIHHADVISIEGDSFRRREAEQTQATRRAKRKG